jgi:hypothetical protein
MSFMLWRTLFSASNLVRWLLDTELAQDFIWSEIGLLFSSGDVAGNWRIGGWTAGDYDRIDDDEG